MKLREIILTLTFLLLGTQMAHASRAYIPTYSGGSLGNVYVFDTETGRPATSYPIQVDAGAIGISVQGSRAYVTNAVANNIKIIDTQRNEVISTIPEVSSPEGVVANRENTQLYVANLTQGSVSLIHLDQDNYPKQTLFLTENDTDRRLIAPQGLALSQNGYLFVSTVGASWGGVTLIDTQNNSVIDRVNLTPSARVEGMALDSNRNIVFLSYTEHVNRNTVSKLAIINFNFSPDQRAPVSHTAVTVELPITMNTNRPGAMAYNPRNDRLYLTGLNGAGDADKGNVIMIKNVSQIPQMEIVSVNADGDNKLYHPYGVSVDPISNQLFVTNLGASYDERGNRFYTISKFDADLRTPTTIKLFSTSDAPPYAMGNFILPTLTLSPILIPVELRTTPDRSPPSDVGSESPGRTEVPHGDSVRPASNDTVASNTMNPSAPTFGSKLIESPAGCSMNANAAPQSSWVLIALFLIPSLGLRVRKKYLVK